jgi:hypothetical protein
MHWLILISEALFVVFGVYLFLYIQRTKDQWTSLGYWVLSVTGILMSIIGVLALKHLLFTL